MYIRHLELNNYRNYQEAAIDFDPGINIIYGDNAQGKTNLIEAIYLCATSKSHRLSKDKELIRINEKDAHVYMVFEKNDIIETVDVHLKKIGKKNIAINKNPIKKLNELFGLINIIMFSPEDLGLIKNGPKDRRRFIDLELSQLKPLYMYYLSHYHKVLKQRNQLLKNNHNRLDMQSLLDVWDDQLVKYGTTIIEMRKNFIEDLKPILYEKHLHLSGKKETLDMVYENDVDVEDYKVKLAAARTGDLKKGTTTVGPHRDDIRFDINKIDIRIYGSQGQQRTAALALKLSEIELIKKQVNHAPILLLDDVLSELDHQRQHYLIEHLKDIQTFITCTGIDDFIKKELNGYQLYQIKDAKVINESDLHKC
ncbi:RecA filament-DNA complex stabilisation, ssDNA and dsDNA binding, ATP binding [Petrocella atlantisensis]|uniref:DNA replication and repair protein RecF n=1 Tax=Petrocella atlantisensis TaxID=2173034 RepID=A0A3P7S5N9_9FIRM|nr:DNA replication/repair protein RecF [Petrocella atlantisensis]PKM53437.1 MAG: DNA replication/repair protein RecF [Firmicutes bacterium HGW-Firmicutes-5]VDN47749.1 RecA filament-DNA complex stabilisation, ssDNA and dsDNA binding, ATP binding [Petrocella atlantisensis]